MAKVLKRADGAERKISGYRKSKPGKSAKKYAGKLKRLPAKVDLRAEMTKVEDQGETSSCVANATAGAFEYLATRYLGDERYDVSRMFIYYNARYCEEDREEIEDDGTYISSAIDGIKEYGACAEETWPFDLDAVDDEPPSEAYDEAWSFGISGAEAVPTDLTAWKTALAEGNPIIFALELYDSFDRQRKKGLVPVPSTREASREDHASHAMLCVGYSDPDQVFIVRNSWGRSWGDKGYCYIPYKYMMNEDYNQGDSWVIRGVEAFETDEGTWSDDDGSIVEDLSEVLSEIDEESWDALLEAVGDLPLETRLAALCLDVAGADGEVTDEELDQIATYLGPILESLGSDLSPAKVLRQAKKLAGDDDLAVETADILGQHFSTSALAGVLGQLRLIASSDELAEEEESWLDWLVDAWQVGEDPAPKGTKKKK